MPFAQVYSAQHHLLKAHLISVEVDLSRGFHAFSVVGLPDKAIEESRDRVSAAIKNSGFKSPKQTNMKVVVSLAPADIRKEGPAFDLPIAIGYLMATGDIAHTPTGGDEKNKHNEKKRLFVGELALDGKVQPVTGVLSFARMAKARGFSEIFVPRANAEEAAIIESIEVFGVESLSQVIAHLNNALIGRSGINPTVHAPPVQKAWPSEMTLDDIVGQESAKRALTIAVSGGHNIGLFGPPGTGKTMLAKAMQGILPPLSPKEMLEVTEIYSASGNLDGSIMLYPPLRAPHHTSSYVSIIGGGSGVPQPGEVTLAHRGLLFMDEFPEFDRKVLEALRQPLEDRSISIARAGGSDKFPANFILVAAMNPCLCGNSGIQGKICSCSASDIARYRRKLSGPIMDRIDMWIEVSKIDYGKLLQKKKGNSGNSEAPETEKAKATVIAARKIQKKRNSNWASRGSADRGTAEESEILNAYVDARSLADSMELSAAGKETLEKAAVTYGLSSRGFHRTVKLARTIADMANSITIEAPHILEALQYRQRV